MAAKPAGERPARSRSFERKGKHILKRHPKRDERSARGFGGSRSRRFRPRRRPSGTTGLQIYIPRQTSALMAKLPSSRPAATPQSRCPSDFYVAVKGATARSPNPERNGKHMLKHRLKRDERSACRFGGLRSRTLSPFPTTRGHVRHPSQTHPIFISLPLWRKGIYSMADPVHIIAVRHCKERGSGVSYIENVARGRVGRGGSRDRMHR